MPTDNFFAVVGLQPDGSGQKLATRSCPGGPAGATAVVSVDLSIPDNLVGFNIISVALAALPTTLTAVTSITTAAKRLVLVNSNSTNSLVQVLDGNSLPLFPSGFLLSPYANLNVDLDGITFTNGLQWRGDSGTYGAFKGYTAF